MKMREWCRTAAQPDSPVGDLMKDISSDSEFPEKMKTKRQLWEYINFRSNGLQAFEKSLSDMTFDAWKYSNA